MDTATSENICDNSKDEITNQSDRRTSNQKMNASSSSTSGYVSGQEEDAAVRECDKDCIPSSIFSSDNPFFPSEDAVAVSTVEELSSAVEQCKQKVFESSECSEERKWLVRNLIELQIILQEKKEWEVGQKNMDSQNPSFMKIRVVLGHHFVLQNQMHTKHYCERCSGVIWSMIHSWYQCRDCSYCCHLKCLSQVCRVCAHVKASEEPNFIMKICPELGLSMQLYRCAECKSHITFAVPKGLSCFGRPFTSETCIEPRRCDYDGKYYCQNCHWNAVSVIPARVIHNWDFEERKVCQSSKQFLFLMAKRPVLKLEEINPMLFNFVVELGHVKKIREDILLMKKYFVSCKDAIESRILWKLNDRQHFTENIDAYSMQDLIDINSGVLVDYLKNIHTIFAKHIKEDCKLCYAKGYLCELCGGDSVIFPFDVAVVICQKCQSVYHKFCWTKKHQQCKKCERVLKRSQQRLENLTVDDDDG